MRALIIDEAVKTGIAELIATANAHRHSAATLKRLMTGDLPPAGDYKQHTILIPDGFRVVFSIEEQPLGWCRHLSVSINDPNKYPHEVAVEMIMQEFGMGLLKDCIHVWVEEEVRAINILSLMEKT